jgi:hypothetical protein
LLYDLNKPAFSQYIFTLAIILDGDDNSSIKESSNDDKPESANEEVNLANAAQTSTPDQGHLRPSLQLNSQPNSSLEFSQGK